MNEMSGIARQEPSGSLPYHGGIKMPLRANLGYIPVPLSDDK